MATSTVEDYLKTLYLKHRAAGGKLMPMGRLAQAMKVAPGTATAMVKTLAEGRLVRYEPRDGVRLTPSGEQLALHVLRRHRLIELFLVNILGLDWSEVHAEAEDLEHAVSDRVLERIDRMLGHPTTDPHGDPIPTAAGQMHEGMRASLADCAVGGTHCVSRIIDQGTAFLAFVKKHGLMPGTQVTVEDHESSGDIVRVRAARGAVVALSSAAAAKILVARGRQNLKPAKKPKHGR